VMLVLMAGIDLVGVRTGKKVRYLLGAVTLVPIMIIMFGAYVGGQFHSANFTPPGIPGHKTLWGAVTLYMYWQYIAGWSAYATEAVAVHAPEYRDTLVDTPRALRSSALFTLVTYALIPLGLIAVLGTTGIAGNTLTPFDNALKTILGNGFGTVIVFFVIAALILAAQMASTASVRALWQMSENRQTISVFSRLNKVGTPDVAVFFTYGVNILLVWTIGSPLWILAASNAGYIGAHILSLGGYLLLRRNEPDAVRPLRLGRRWSWIAGLLLVVNLACRIVGAPLYGPGPLMAGLGLVFGLSLGLYAVRRFLQPESRDLEEGPDTVNLSASDAGLTSGGALDGGHTPTASAPLQSEESLSPLHEPPTKAE
jgi:amino acid transporter